MFAIRNALLNAKRHKLKSILVILACMLIVIFLFLYIGGLEANSRMLENLPEAITIPARISNLSGTLSTGMMIKESVIKGIEESDYIADYFYTAELGAALGAIPEDKVSEMEQGRMNFPLCLGVNRLSAYTDLNEEDVTFIDGYGPEMLESDEPVCIVRDRDLALWQINTGDTIDLTLFYIIYPNDNAVKDFRWMGIYPVKIIGSSRDIVKPDAERRSMQVIFPVKWLQKLSHQRETMFFADAARFRIAKPLELNAFKDEMKELGLMSVISQAKPAQRGIALIVSDETFIKAATRLKENISLMKSFMPFLLIVVGLVGFVVSYLLLHSRKPEFAVMRSLGVSKKSCFIILFFEYAILDLAGSCLGVLAIAAFSSLTVSLTAVVVTLFFCAYMAGTAAALVMLNRFSVMEVLSALD
ncbi:MAG: transporter permease [Bacillota bacterium]|nr:transporter permease [Bacillota bacterium]